jgi:hypothetical protein
VTGNSGAGGAISDSIADGIRRSSASSARGDVHVIGSRVGIYAACVGSVAIYSGRASSGRGKKPRWVSRHDLRM